MKKYKEPVGVKQMMAKGIKWALGAEVALAGVFGCFMYKLYYNQDYRQAWSNKHPWLLETYYNIMTPYHGTSQKEQDLKKWQEESSSSQK